MKFTESARQQAEAYWTGSFNHSFVTDLQSGTLAPAVFRFYLLQDRYYLMHFSQLYQLIGQQTTNTAVKDVMLANAEYLAAGEIAIRRDFFEELQITEREIAETPIAPTAYHYVSHMYRQLLEGTPNTAFAGMLPCSWLYQEIGTRLHQQGSPDPLYQRWIETYAGPEAAVAVQRERELLDQLYDSCPAAEQQKMLQAFYISSQMEYNFWEMAIQLETWPTGAEG